MVIKLGFGKSENRTSNIILLYRYYTDRDKQKKH